MSKEQQIQALREEIEKIKARNRRVEADKKWETSVFRIISIGVMTYLVMTLFMIYISASNPLVSAIVPTVGFILSTLSLLFLKKLWQKFNHN